MPKPRFAPLTIEKIETIKDNHNNLKDRVLILETTKKVFIRAGVFIAMITIPLVVYIFIQLEHRVAKLETNIVEIQRNNNCPNPPLPKQSSSSIAS